MRIGVIGSGISGLSAGWLLSQHHDVVLFEKDTRVGGHSNTITVAHKGKSIPVDTGFIVFNEKTYPHLMNLFRHLDVPYHASDMSFGITSPTLEYSGRTLGSLFAQKANILNFPFWKMLKDIICFNGCASRADPEDFSLSLEEYVDQCGVSHFFKEYYLYPMVSAIWSTPQSVMRDYPAASFLAFFQNHGLLQARNQPQWYTVTGGSQVYVRKILQQFQGTVCLNEGVQNIFTKDGQVHVRTHKKVYVFDQVILATHGDESAQLLEDTSQGEVLKQFSYSTNKAYLHSDSSFMPRAKKAWASWIYTLSKDSLQDSPNTTTLTYWMNSLQFPRETLPLFVTLNPSKAPDNIHYQTTYKHPMYDAQSIKAQRDVQDMQGKDGIWFCGAYLGYGFHEDGLRSSIEACKRLGVNPPWVS